MRGCSEGLDGKTQGVLNNVNRHPSVGDVELMLMHVVTLMKAIPGVLTVAKVMSSVICDDPNASSEMHAFSGMCTSFFTSVVASYGWAVSYILLSAF